VVNFHLPPTGQFSVAVDTRRPFVLVDQATQDRSTRDVFMAEVRYGVGRPWWAKIAGAMGPPTVVMANIFRGHDTQVPLAEDQHAVGEFDSEGADEPFSEAVRPRAPKGNRDHVDAHIGQDGVE
jgi:hypothetical protein